MILRRFGSALDRSAASSETALSAGRDGGVRGLSVIVIEVYGGPPYATDCTTRGGRGPTIHQTVARAISTGPCRGVGALPEGKSSDAVSHPTT